MLGYYSRSPEEQIPAGGDISSISGKRHATDDPTCVHPAEPE